MQVMEWPPQSRRADTLSQVQVQSLRSRRSTAVSAAAPAPSTAGKGAALAYSRARLPQLLGQSGMLPVHPAGCPDRACSQSAALAPAGQKPELVESSL